MAEKNTQKKNPPARGRGIGEGFISFYFCWKSRVLGKRIQDELDGSDANNICQRLIGFGYKFQDFNGQGAQQIAQIM